MPVVEQQPSVVPAEGQVSHEPTHQTFDRFAHVVSGVGHVAAALLMPFSARSEAAVAHATANRWETRGPKVTAFDQPFPDVYYSGN